MKNAIHVCFISNTRLILAKNGATAKPCPEAELLLSENRLLSSSTLSSNGNRTYSKKSEKRSCVCFNEIILIIMKKKMKNRSHRHNINRMRSRCGHKYTKYKVLICIKQHISNT